MGSCFDKLFRTSLVSDRLALHVIGGGGVAFFSWAALTVMIFRGASAYWPGFVLVLPSLGIAILVGNEIASCRFGLIGLFLAYLAVDVACFFLAAAIVVFGGGIHPTPPG